MPHASPGAAVCAVFRSHHQSPQCLSCFVQCCQPEAVLHQGVLSESKIPAPGIVFFELQILETSYKYMCLRKGQPLLSVKHFFLTVYSSWKQLQSNCNVKGVWDAGQTTYGGDHPTEADAANEVPTGTTVWIIRYLVFTAIFCTSTTVKNLFFPSLCFDHILDKGVHIYSNNHRYLDGRQM